MSTFAQIIAEIPGGADLITTNLPSIARDGTIRVKAS
jgi:hypothetical protein